MEGVVTIRLEGKHFILLGAIALVLVLGSQSQSGGGGGGGGGSTPHRPTRTEAEWAQHYDKRQTAWGNKLLRMDWHDQAWGTHGGWS